MRTAVAVFLAGLASVLGGAASAEARPAPRGKVFYALQTPYAYPDGPDAPGTADGRAAMRATYTLCPRSPAIDCRWTAYSFATRGTSCPQQPWIEPYPWPVWGSAVQTGNTTVRSGEQRFAMGTPLGLELQTVCLYVERDGIADDDRLVAERRFALERTVR